MDASFENIAKRLIDELMSARNKLSIAVAWFTNESIFDILLKKLSEGVSIELILINDHINNRDNGLDLNKFIECGGRLHFSKGGSLMHNKFVVIDNDRVITGSYNWTYNAEFRNNENIVHLSDPSIIQKFEEEFSNLRGGCVEQLGKVESKPKSVHDIDFKEYLKNDYVSKSYDAERKGELEKAMDAITQACEMDPTDNELKVRYTKVKRKYSPEYHYHVEDGQFSYDFSDKRLLGKEGEVINVRQPYDDGYDNEIYILYIDEYYVECIGNVDRTFPKNQQEHQEIKAAMLGTYEDN